MGVVYLARDRFLEREVAIKLVAESELTLDGVERFLREARAMARLSHPNVVTVFRAGVTEGAVDAQSGERTGGAPFLVMELLRGRSLDAVLEQEGALSPAKLLLVAIEAARGISAAHARGVVHRDIKPSNLFETDEGAIKVLDFGIAKVAATQPSSASAGPTIDPSSTEKSASGRITAASLLPASKTGSQTHSAQAAQLAMALDATLAPSVSGASGDSGSREPQQIALEQTMAGASDAQLAVADTRSSGGGAGSRDSSTGTQVSGTALFMAPEVWRAEGADHATDVWSLGATLYMLATQKPPFDGRSVAEIAFNVLVATPVAALAPRRADLPAELVEVIEKCLSKNRAKRFASAQEVLLALERISRAERSARAPKTDSPYPGLRAMDAQDRDHFFGRDDDSTRVIERLRGESLVVLVGASGTGKSSLAAAGVAPAVAEGVLGELRPWRVARVRPGRAPVRVMAEGLSSLVGIDADTLSRELLANTDALARTLRECVARDGQGVLLLLDQLEELVTSSNAEERDAMAAALARLVEVAPRGVRVLATARSDLFDRLGALGELGARLGRATELVRPLEGAYLRAAIVEPARAAGATFEDESLVDRILDEVGASSGALPLIAFAMRSWWDRRDREQRVLTSDAWRSLGGVLGALGGHADAVFDALGGEERDAARAVFSRLLGNDGTRRYATRDELDASASGKSAEVGRVLAAFSAARLIQCEGDESSGNWTITHESLYRAWPRLRQWIESGREDRALHQQLTEAARAWDANGKRNELLWRGALLQEIARWQVVYDDLLSPIEREFVLRSTAREKRSRRTGAVVFGVTVFALGGAAIAQARSASAQRARAAVAEQRASNNEQIARSEGDARAVAAALEGLGRDPSVALAWLLSAARARGEASMVTRVAALAAVERGVSMRVRCTSNVAMRENASLISCAVDDAVLIFSSSEGTVRRIEATRSPRSVAVADRAEVLFWVDSGQQLVRWDDRDGRRRLATDVSRNAHVLSDPTGTRAAVIDIARDRVLVWDEAPAAARAPSAADGGVEAIGDTALRMALEHLMPEKIEGEWRAYLPVKEAMILAVRGDEGHRVRRVPLGRGSEQASEPMLCATYEVNEDTLLCHDGATLRAYSVSTGTERAPTAAEIARIEERREPDAPTLLARNGDVAIERTVDGLARLRGEFPFAGPLGALGVRVEAAAIESVSHRVALVDASSTLHLYGLSAIESTLSQWTSTDEATRNERLRSSQSGRPVVVALPSEQAAVAAVGLGVYSVEARTGRPLWSSSLPDAVAVNAESNNIIVGTSDGTGVLVDPFAHTLVRGTLLEGDSPIAVAVSANARRAVAVGGRGDPQWRVIAPGGQWRRVNFRSFSELSGASAVATMDDQLAIAGRWLGVVQEGGLTTLANAGAAFFTDRVARLRFASAEELFAVTESSAVYWGRCREQRCQLEWIGEGDDLAPIAADAALTIGAKGGVRLLMRGRPGAIDVISPGRLPGFASMRRGASALDVDDIAVLVAGPADEPALARVSLPPGDLQGFSRWVAARTNVSVVAGANVTIGSIPAALP